MYPRAGNAGPAGRVSMKSGLEGRNNERLSPGILDLIDVSMKSGLEGRNNKTLPRVWNG